MHACRVHGILSAPNVAMWFWKRANRKAVMGPAEQAPEWLGFTVSYICHLCAMRVARHNPLSVEFLEDRLLAILYPAVPALQGVGRC
jgi:hypothetical protein